MSYASTISNNICNTLIKGLRHAFTRIIIYTYLARFNYEQQNQNRTLSR